MSANLQERTLEASTDSLWNNTATIMKQSFHCWIQSLGILNRPKKLSTERSLHLPIRQTWRTHSVKRLLCRLTCSAPSITALPSTRSTPPLNQISSSELKNSPRPLSTVTRLLRRSTNTNTFYKTSILTAEKAISQCLSTSSTANALKLRLLILLQKLIWSATRQNSRPLSALWRAPRTATRGLSNCWLVSQALVKFNSSVLRDKSRPCAPCCMLMANTSQRANQAKHWRMLWQLKKWLKKTI